MGISDEEEFLHVQLRGSLSFPSCSWLQSHLVPYRSGSWHQRASSCQRLVSIRSMMVSYVKCAAANCGGGWVVRISQGVSSQEGGEVQVQSLVISLAKSRLHLELGTCDIGGPSYIDSPGNSLKHELDVIWS